MDAQALGQLFPLVLFALAVWLLFIRPSRKRAAGIAEVQRSLQPGSEVMLTSGIFGTLESVDDEAVALRVAPGTTMRVHRQAVTRVVQPAQPIGGEPDGDGRPPGATSL